MERCSSVQHVVYTGVLLSGGMSVTITLILKEERRCTDVFKLPYFCNLKAAPSAFLQATSTKQMLNFSDLPHDVLVVIAKRLKTLEDFVSFKCISKSLFGVAKDEYFEGIRLRQRTPYLMLPVRDDVAKDDVRELYSLVEGESIVTSVKAPNLKTKKCFESLGWILAVGEDGDVSLFDPFSDAVIPLPHLSTFPGYQWEDLDNHNLIQKTVLSARPSDTSDFVLIVIAGGSSHLKFWRLGDEAWNGIEAPQMEVYMDVTYHGNGQFFTISTSGFHPSYLGIVRVFNFVGNSNTVNSRLILSSKLIVPNFASMDPLPGYLSMNLYILKTDDSLLVITRKSPDLSEDGLHYMTSEFKVYEVDTDTGAWNEIYSLGSMAVFVGHSATIALDAARSPGGVIKPNHIYFTDDSWEYYLFFQRENTGSGKNMGVYNMETGSVEPIYPGEPLLSKASITIWITPFP